MTRRQHLTATLAAAILSFLLLTYYLSSDSKNLINGNIAVSPKLNVVESQESKPGAALSDLVLEGGSIAPKLGNATAKAELGRASWKLLHTMMARFPENPTLDEQTALRTFVQLFGRLYPCGECASHFRKLLAVYPPQTSSRNAAAGWACAVHNKVNIKLKKSQFDCSKIGDFYDCGCGDDGKDGKPKAGGEVELKERKNVMVENQGLVRGG